MAFIDEKNKNKPKLYFYRRQNKVFIIKHSFYIK